MISYVVNPKESDISDAYAHIFFTMADKYALFLENQKLNYDALSYIYFSKK